MLLRRIAVSLLFCAPVALVAQVGVPGSANFPNVDYHDSGSQAQLSGAKRDPNFSIKVNSDVVAVDLIAIGVDGRPVLDLRPDELTIKEDGKKRPISNFIITSRSTGNVSTLAKLQDATKTAPPNVFTNFQGTHAEVPRNGCTVVVMDALNTSLADQAFSREHLLKFISTLRPEQPVAIYSLAGNLYRIQDFTSDSEKLKEAVTQYAAHPTLLQPGTTPNSDRPLTASLPPARSNAQIALQSTIRYYDAELSNLETDERVRTTIKALAALARHISAVDGRKNLIWLSSAFPIEIGGLGTAPGQSYGDPRGYAGEVAALGRILSNANVALYPVDARGLMSGFFDASLKGSENGIPAWAPGAYTTQLDQTTRNITDPQRTMEMLADATGGRAFFNTNDIYTALQTAATDGSSFYALSFKPGTYSADGSYHSIKVTTSRKGVQLRYRNGYYAADANERDEFKKKMERLEVEQALLDQKSLSTGLPLMAQVDQARGDVIDLWIHGGSLSILSNDNKPMVRFEVAAVTFDRTGRVLTKSTVLVNTSLKMERLNAVLNDGLSQNVKFEHRPEAARLRLAIRDVPSGRIGTIDVPLEPKIASTNSSPAPVR